MFRRLKKRGVWLAVGAGVLIGYALAGRGVDLHALFDFLMNRLGLSFLFTL